MATKKKAAAKKVGWDPTDVQYLAGHPKAVAAHPVFARTHPGTMRRVKTQRAKNAANANPLYNPLAQLSGYDLQRSAQQLAGAQVDPAVKAINEQIKTTQGVGDAQSRRAQGYYTQLAQEVQGGLDQQRAISDRLNSQLAGVQSDTAGRTSQAAQQAGQQLQGDQAIRGPVSDQGGLQKEIAAAMAAQAGDAQAFRSAGAQSGAASQSLGQTTLDTSRLRGGEVQTDIMVRTRQAISDLGQKRTDVEATRGGLVAKALADLRQNEFEKFATVQGLGIKQATIDQQGQIAGAKLGQQQDTQAERERHDRATERNTEIANAIRDFSAHHPKSAAGTDPAKFKATFQKDFKAGYNLAWATLSAYGPLYVYGSPAAIQAKLQGQRGAATPGGQAAIKAALKRWKQQHKPIRGHAQV